MKGRQRDVQPEAQGQINHLFSHLPLFSVNKLPAMLEAILGLMGIIFIHE